MSQSDALGRTSEGDHGMSLQICSHCPIYVTQRHLSVYILPARGKLMCGVQGDMTLEALGGVNSPCSWYRVKGQPPSDGGQVHTHTQTQFLSIRKLLLLNNSLVFQKQKYIVTI